MTGARTPPRLQRCEQHFREFGCALGGTRTPNLLIRRRWVRALQPEGSCSLSREGETQAVTQGREVLDFDGGVRVYAPSTDGGYGRLRWEEQRRRRDTTAPTKAAAIVKAGEIVERLGRAAPTELGRARGADLVAHYLDPTRRPPRVTRWSDRHRDEQTRYCYLYVLPVVATVPCRDITRVDFQHILDQARTASVAQHLRRCLTGIVAAGLEEGHLPARPAPRCPLARRVPHRPRPRRPGRYPSSFSAART
jgi:hypothetical protein